jgi:hypothetical protein
VSNQNDDRAWSDMNIEDLEAARKRRSGTVQESPGVGTL